MSIYDKIPPKITCYKGITYRSKLEARYAALFTALELDFQYEPRIFSTPYGGYIPDFYISSWNCWVEVKPNILRDRTPFHKLAHVSQATDNVAIMCISAPIDNVVYLYGANEFPVWMRAWWSQQNDTDIVGISSDGINEDMIIVFESMHMPFLGASQFYYYARQGKWLRNAMLASQLLLNNDRGK